MFFTPKTVQDKVEEDKRNRDYALNTWQKRASYAMLFMVMITFTFSNVWALFWQASDWLTATVLPAVVVDLTNQERASGDIHNLIRNEKLDEAARLKAEHMAREGYFAHYSPDGVAPWHWFREVDYVFAHAGENLAVHFTDSYALVNAWMNSPTHRQNIENTNFTEIGVGTARGRYNGFDTIFVVQMFGAPALLEVEEQNEISDVSIEIIESVEGIYTAEGEDTATTSSPTTTVATVTDEDMSNDVAVEIEDIDDVAVRDFDEYSTSAGTTSTTTIPQSQIVAEGQSDGGALAEPVEVLVERTQSPEESEVVLVASDSVDESLSMHITTSTNMARNVLHTNYTGAEILQEESHRWIVSTHTISSDLPVATSTVDTTSDMDIGPLARLGTQPNTILQMTYTVLGLMTSGMLLWSLQLEIRRRRYVQMMYSVSLFALMVGLWYVHMIVTSSGIII